MTLMWLFIEQFVSISKALTAWIENDQFTNNCLEVKEKRRERLKSALFLRLKKRKTLCFGKKLEIFEKKFFSEKVAQCQKM